MGWSTHEAQNFNSCSELICLLLPFEMRCLELNRRIDRLAQSNYFHFTRAFKLNRGNKSQTKKLCVWHKNWVKLNCSAHQHHALESMEYSLLSNLFNHALRIQIIVDRVIDEKFNEDQVYLIHMQALCFRWFPRKTMIATSQQNWRLPITSTHFTQKSLQIWTKRQQQQQHKALQRT